MVEEVIEYLRTIEEFHEFNQLEVTSLKKIFGSPKQIFAIASFDDENQLQVGWQKASEEFAVRIQSQLVDTLYNLKWDMYLVLIVESEIQDKDLSKSIENDRRFFKKIVLTKNEKNFEKKLPIELDMVNSDNLEFFSDREFLIELKKVIKIETFNRMDFSIYEKTSLVKANEQIFLEPYKSKGAQK